MFSVTVIDDSTISAEKTSEIVKRTLAEDNPRFKIMVCTTTDMLSKTLEDETSNLIITTLTLDRKNISEFLDGKKYPKTSADIIILSSSAENWRNGYDIGAIAYLVQPVDENTISKIVRLSLSRHKSIFKTMMVKDVEGRHFFIHRDRIIKIEIMNKELYVYLSDGKIIHSRRSIADISCCEYLPFIRCHNSFYINLNYAISCERYIFTLKNGDTVPISKIRYKEIRELFKNAKFDLAR